MLELGAVKRLTSVDAPIPAKRPLAENRLLDRAAARGVAIVAGTQLANLAMWRQRATAQRPQRKKEAPLGGFLHVGETGLEPATSAMSKQCSNQLSYPPGMRSL
jgi:hypothetical protein